MEEIFFLAPRVLFFKTQNKENKFLLSGFDSKSLIKLYIFSSWLHKNVVKARMKQKSLEPIQRKVNKLIEKVKDVLGLKSIAWDNDWGLSHFHACLIGLLRMYKTYNLDLKLQGRFNFNLQS